MTFDRLINDWQWEPIRNCPGRYVLTGARADLSPQALLGGEVILSVYDVKTARDTVMVARFSGGGLITYKRENGTYLHTLNTEEGLARKLLQLGIEPGEPGEVGCV
jgi:hypothetical protein